MPPPIARLALWWTALSLLVLTSVLPPAYAQDSVASFLAEGDAHYNQLDNRSALDAYEKAYAQNTEAFEVLLRMARTYNDYAMDLLASGDKEAAEAHFVKAVSYAEAMETRDPNRAETHFFLAGTNGNLALFKGGKDKVRIGRAVEQYSLGRGQQWNRKYR